MEGDTTSTDPVAPVLQEYVLDPFAVRVAELPAQIVAIPEMVITGTELTLTFATAVLVQPSLLVPVTVYTALVEGEMLMDAFVLLLLHR